MTLSHYETLRDRVSQKFFDIQKKHSESFACKLNCHSCCKPGLTVSPIEAKAIKNYLTKNKTAFAAWGENRCAFLSKTGACAIYPARPLVCRSHGAPLQFFDQKSKSHFRDTCPLNFTDKELTAVPAEDVINLDTLNTLLATLNIQAFGKKDSLMRIPLNPQAIQDFPRTSGILALYS